MKLEELTMDDTFQIDVAASREKVWDALLARLADKNESPAGPMPMKLEAKPGGRWYRDQGENTGHFWGHVQVIKPPRLLELCGPMFMSYAVAGHIEYKLEETDSGTRVTLRYRGIGFFDPQHREGMHMGWNLGLDNIKKDAEAGG